MADQIAGLTLGVDVSQVQAATKSLKDFKQANNETAQSLGDLVTAESIAAAKAKQLKSEQESAARATKQIRSEYERSLKVIDPLTAKMNELSNAAKVMDKAWQAGVIPDKEFFRLGEAIDEQNRKLLAARFAFTEEGQAAAAAAAQKVAASKAAEQAARKEEAAREAASLKAQNASDRFIQSLQEQVNAIGKTKTELLEMKAAQLGVSEQAAPLINQLRDQTQQMKLAGISAGQYSQAMRVLPMQITDVVTSLASGIPVWQVAIQQGGQIKDSFGGVGNTFKVLLSYLTPVSLALGGVAAIIAGMGLSAYDAYKNQSRLNEALILSGNYAAASSGEFNKMTESVSSASNATSGMVRDIATSLAESGKYTINQIKLITKVTADWATATGKDSKEIVGYFDKIAKDPVKGLADLNEQFNFLSVGQLTYIDSLKKTKGETEAVSAATKIFADVMEQRVAKIAESATPLEKMWSDIKKWSGDAWDTVGERTLGALNLITDVVAGTVEQIRYLLNQGDIIIGEFVANTAKTLSNIPGTKGFFQDVAVQQEEVVKNAKAQNEDLIKSINDRNERIKKGEMGYVQMAKEGQKAQEQYSQKVKDGVAKEAEGLSKKSNQQKTIVDQGDKISEQYQADILALQAQLKVLQDHKSVNDKISQQQKTYWNDVAKFQVLEEAAKTRTLTKQEQQLLAQKETVLQYSKQKAEIGNQIVQQERLNKLQDDSTKYIDEMNAKSAALTANMAMSTKEQERQNELAKLRSDWTAAGGSEADSELAKKTEALQNFYAQQDAMQADWLAGAQRAFADWGDSVSNMYANVGNIATNTLDGMTSSLTDFVTTGKANFDDFAKSVIKDIIQMTIRMAIFNSMAGFFGGGAGASSSNAFSAGSYSSLGFAKGGYTGSGGKYEPAGVVHKGEFVFTKEATSRIGTKNLYQMMRGYASGGSVGGTYQSGSGGGGGGVAIAVGDIAINTGEGMDKANAKSMESGVRQIVTDMLVTECSQGGRIYNLVKGG